MVPSPVGSTLAFFPPEDMGNGTESSSSNFGRLAPKGGTKTLRRVARDTQIVTPIIIRQAQYGPTRAVASSLHRLDTYTGGHVFQNIFPTLESLITSVEETSTKGNVALGCRR